ncbi:MAG TPA: Sir2 family NAD-dependent protein deacetylase, partial [Pseudohaliea sp.]|nr:Sir2 family NAD-dependent protein deacetylase [Pseudohaliea sp.]
MDEAAAALDELAGALARARAALFVTGAGVSLASGIDTFRGSDPGALWHNDIMAKATLGHFRRDPADAWAWYLSRFERVAAAEPNPAHRALAALEGQLDERGAQSLLVTQNIDGLHHRAGSRALVEIHGKARRVRCSAPRCPEATFGTLAFEADAFMAFRREPAPARLPRCPHCGDGLLRPHVLWFDEHYQSHPDYGFERVLSFLPTADL